jgi:hypothetical protein
MEFTSRVDEMSPDSDEAYVDLPDGTRKRLALSLREQLAISGGAWDFDLPTPIPGSNSTQPVRVSLRSYEGRDLDTTFVRITTTANLSLEEAQQLQLRDGAG